MDKFFLAQAKRTNGVIEKGLVVKDTLDAAKQSYYAYLGAYGFGKDPNTDYVLVQIIDGYGVTRYGDVWQRTQPEPEGEV